MKNQLPNPVAQATNLSVMTLLKILGGAVLIYAGAKVAIPLQPVPITLQTFAVLLVALVLPRGEALAAVLAYVAAGLAGAPVFASGLVGPAALVAPSGGYIIGFVVAVAVAGLVKEKFGGRRFLPLLVAAMVGEVIIFACGLLWLSVLLGPSRALAVGLTPFILPEVLKAFFLAGALRAVGAVGAVKK